MEAKNIRTTDEMKQIVKDLFKVEDKAKKRGCYSQPNYLKTQSSLNKYFNRKKVSGIIRDKYLYFRIPVDLPEGSIALNNIKFERCIFEDISFSGSMNRCEFIDCVFLGYNCFSDCIITNVKFTNVIISSGNHVEFSRSQLNSVEFENIKTVTLNGSGEDLEVGILNELGSCLSFSNVKFTNQLVVSETNFDTCYFNNISFPAYTSIAKEQKVDKNVIQYAQVTGFGDACRTVTYLANYDCVIVGCFNGKLKDFKKKFENDIRVYTDEIKCADKDNKKHIRALEIAIELKKAYRIAYKLFQHKRKIYLDSINGI
jgi:hypothetical protein